MRTRIGQPAARSCARSPGTLARVGVAMALGLSLCGCAGVRRPPSSNPAPERAAPVPGATRETTPEKDQASPPRDDTENAGGIFHRVEPGQTLWRIAKVYGVEMEELAAANGIADPRSIEVGQDLYIPRATRALGVPAYPAPLPEVPAPLTQPPSSGAGVARDFDWPVAGGGVISSFGARRRTHRHAGVDIRGALGQDVVAAQSGVVTFSGRTGTGYGNLVIVDHGGGVETLYAHDQGLLVRVGDSVVRGQAIARVGRTGNATTPHCHFEVRLDRVPVDPMPYFVRIAEARRP